MRKLLKFIFITLFLSLTADCFAQIKLLSPEEGLWSNQQMLVIDTAGTENYEYFYSLNGSDPAAFGFVYDGPVLLEMTGDVQLRIKKVGKSQSDIEEKILKYSVIQDDAYTKNYASFISSFYDTGVLNYSSGSVLSIPENLEYCLTSQPYNFIEAQDISISEKSVLSRYIPCTVRDTMNGKKWHFIIRTFPQTAGVFSRRDVPFVVEDWENITFTNENLIYKIDSGFWELPKESKKLDRSVSHLISWQNIVFEPGNPVEFFILPPKPEIIQTVADDGSVDFSIKGDDSYTLSVLSYEEKVYQELFEEIGVDTFYGDSISGNLKIGVFTNSVYQGEIIADYAINKRPPAVPVITPSVTGFNSRQPVTLKIECEENCELYYGISEPFVLDDLKKTYTQTSSDFKDIDVEIYTKCDGNSVTATLQPNKEGAVYFKVKAYSNDGLSKGKVAEYSVIIDQYNYYYDENAVVENPDGTADSPFNDFSNCIDFINKGRFARIYVKGNVHIPKGTSVIQSNTVFENIENGMLVFAPDSTVCVQNSNLQLDGFRIQTEGTAPYNQAKIIPAIKLENSVLDLSNCQISLLYGKSGTFIDCYNSSANVFSTIASVNASSYSAFISGVKSRFNIQDSSINVSADTGVVISLNEGNVQIKNNSFKVIGLKGRIAEFFNVKGSILDNKLKSDLRMKSSVSPIYLDKQSSVTQTNNDASAF